MNFSYVYVKHIKDLIVNVLHMLIKKSQYYVIVIFNFARKRKINVYYFNAVHMLILNLT